MSAVMNHVEMVEHVKMDLTSIYVNVDLVTKVVNVKEKLMNANPTLVNMEELAIVISTLTLAHALRDSREEIVRRTSTIAS